MVRQVEVVPHNPQWSKMYHSEAKILRTVLDYEILATYHIGSTSIPFINSKPIIDILVEVRDIERIDWYNDKLEALGYRAKGEMGILGRRYFVKDSKDVRTHHLHIFQVDNPEVRRHIDFRDYMITHPQDADTYSQLKERLAKEFHNDVPSYVEGKDAFLKEMTQNAMEWKDSIVW
jgi:GrpB-like predicted nucleotidyltransferase (UPF0157 family)